MEAAFTSELLNFREGSAPVRGKRTKASAGRAIDWPRNYGPEGHREHRRESGDGGRPKWWASVAVITGIDESRKTGDESPDGSRNIINPHTWPVCAKIATTSGGQGETTQDCAIGLGHEPIQADAGNRVCGPQALTRCVTSSSTGVRRLEPLRSCSVAGCGSRERKSALPLAPPFRNPSVSRPLIGTAYAMPTMGLEGCAS